MKDLKEKTYKSYKATLIGKDGFIKETIIRYPMPQIFIPKIEAINCYLGEPILLSKPTTEYRIFSLKDHYKDKLQYREL
jgi:hypothetical protein